MTLYKTIPLGKVPCSSPETSLCMLSWLKAGHGVQHQNPLGLCSLTHSLAHGRIHFTKKVEKEWDTDTCYNMDEPWEHDTKYKPVTRDHIVHGSIYIKYPKRANPQRPRQTVQRLPGARRFVGKLEVTAKGGGGFLFLFLFLNDKSIVKLTVVPFCDYIRKHWIVYFKWVNCHDRWIISQ